MSLQQSATPPVTAVIVLAAGQGTRMRSTLPKVLHPLAGKPLLWHALRAAAALQPRHLIAVVGYGRDQVEEYLSGATDLAELPIVTAVQAEQRGTGHAVECALDSVGALTGTVVVSYGDVPLLRPETLTALATAHADQGNTVTVLTSVVADPTGYGRIVRTASGEVGAIIEHRDADDEVRAIHEINTGVYAFDGTALGEFLARVEAGNSQGERYLTDVLSLAVAAGRRVGSVSADDPLETEGVNDRVQLATMATELRARLVRRAQLAGVTIHDPATTYLHADVTIGADTEILPGTHIEAGTAIGEGCVIGPDTTLVACEVDDGASVVRSHCIRAHIGTGAQVGPFTHLRPGSDIGAGAQVGAFVEVKNAQVGAGAKSHHLAYLGDATVGPGANIGAGVITANYDGVHKFRTEIGEYAFIGTNSTLVAPVTVADGAFVAAGSTITADVDPGDLAVARGRQRSIRDWVLRRRAGTAGADAALRSREASYPVETDTQGDPAAHPASDTEEGHPAP